MFIGSTVHGCSGNTKHVQLSVNLVHILVKMVSYMFVRVLFWLLLIYYFYLLRIISYFVFNYVHCRI